MWTTRRNEEEVLGLRLDRAALRHSGHCGRSSVTCCGRQLPIRGWIFLQQLSNNRASTTTSASPWLHVFAFCWLCPLLVFARKGRVLAVVLYNVSNPFENKHELEVIYCRQSGYTKTNNGFCLYLLSLLPSSIPAWMLSRYLSIACLCQ